jgi:serine protease AprX
MSWPVAIDLRNVTRAFAVALAASILALGLASSAPTASESASRLGSVIVQGVGGSSGARAEVEKAGGKVTHDLPIVGGVSATVPENKLPQLESSPAVLQVSPNDKVTFQSDKAVKRAHQISNVVNANKLWGKGIDGSGTRVAVLDTGVHAPHPDLGGRVVHCEDFSHEADTEAHCADTFGHGTFMAGLVAGDGTSSGGKHKGAAPGADIVSIKAAGYDGSTDVSIILAGIQWAVAHKDEFGIRVLNLSLGTDSAQDYRLSPLNYAVQRAWNEGIVVVVSASNSGPDSHTITKPGDDPYVITVGASNHLGTVSLNDDIVPMFSSRGPTRSNGLAKPDVVAPGTHTISLRSPGSAIDSKYGDTARVEEHYFKGSGTSMSTALVSGIVAQMLQEEPNLNPNQVKHRLMSTATPIEDDDPLSSGAGSVNALAAVTSDSMEEANQGVEEATGLGLLQADRGGLEVEVVTPLGQLYLFGEFSAQLDPDGVSLTNPTGLLPWTASTWKTEGWDASTWKASTWKTEDWAASTWKASTWKASTWKASTWKGTEWTNVDWDASTWKNVDWDASTWKASTWKASTWKASTWKSKWYAATWD